MVGMVGALLVSGIAQAFYERAMGGSTLQAFMEGQNNVWFVQGIVMRLVFGFVFAAGYVVLMVDLLTIGRKRIAAERPEGARGGQARHERRADDRHIAVAGPVRIACGLLWRALLPRPACARTAGLGRAAVAAYLLLGMTTGLLALTALDFWWKALLLASFVAYWPIPPLTWRFLENLHEPEEQHS